MELNTTEILTCLEARVDMADFVVKTGDLRRFLAVYSVAVGMEGREEGEKE